MKILEELAIDLNSKKNINQTLYITLHFLISIFIIIVFAFIWFKLFGLTPENLFSLLIVSLFFSMIFGYFLAKKSLKPIFETNEKLDTLLKETLHELNIPVSTIKANVSMLKKNELDLKKIERLNRIEKASSTLIKYYERVDRVIKQEIFDIQKEYFNIKTVIEDELKNFSQLTKLTISHDIDNLTIFADKIEFIKAFNNLIDNAIKYNFENGFVKVELKNGKLKIIDSGIGISHDKILLIFDRYFQEDKNAKGAGIGLSIVKEFCDNHKIQISIKSKINEGTIFILDFIECIVMPQEKKQLFTDINT
ncbi:MAG: HAMP domain-containing histidine kinase [Campylobacterales bacterium]|nr:HAMP domain-containing histidine kinase [Campylobacterales bacterium]